MVLYFKARPDAGDYTIYMGADKNENEELIKYGLPEDVWYVRTSSLAAATSYFLATTTTTTCRMRFSGELNHGEAIQWWVWVPIDRDMRASRSLALPVCRYT